MPALDLQNLSLLTQAAARAGSDLDAVLRALDLRVVSEPQRFSRLPLALIARINGALEAGATRLHFPFAFADAFQFDEQPALAAFLASAPNFRETHRLLDWVPRLIHPAIRLSTADDGERAPLIIRIEDEDPALADLPVLVEQVAAVSARFARQLSPDAYPITGVQFRHAARRPEAEYRDYFGCTVRFGTGLNCLWFDSGALDGPLPGGLPLAHAKAEELIQTRLLGDGVAPPVARLVEDLLRKRFDLLGAGIGQVAAALRLHPRTLQRRLREEQRVYAEIVARVRHELACELLRVRDLDIDSIAAKLGYTERRSFTQAFRNWHRQTPSEYRQAVLRRAAGEGAPRPE